MKLDENTPKMPFIDLNIVSWKYLFYVIFLCSMCIYVFMLRSRMSQNWQKILKYKNIWLVTSKTVNQLLNLSFNQKLLLNFIKTLSHHPLNDHKTNNSTTLNYFQFEFVCSSSRSEQNHAITKCIWKQRQSLGRRVNIIIEL